MFSFHCLDTQYNKRKAQQQQSALIVSEINIWNNWSWKNGKGHEV